MANQGQFVSGAILTAAELNGFTPLTVLTNTTTQLVPNATFTAITYDTETTDTLNWHSTSSNTSRITPNIAGFYLVSFNGVSNGASTRNISAIYKNGAVVAKTDVSTTTTALDITTVVSLNGTTDYVESVLYQQNGSSVNCGPCVFSVMLVRAS